MMLQWRVLVRDNTTKKEGAYGKVNGDMSGMCVSHKTELRFKCRLHGKSNGLS